MFSITLICMGKLKEKFYTEAAAEYAKRLKAYCAFQLIELPECRLPEDPSAAQIAQGLQKEAELIRAKLPKGCFFCVLTPEGRLLSSEEPNRLPPLEAPAFSSARRSASRRRSRHLPTCSCL